jgi:3-hydroxyisobutyrate dehydrogenase-like beta-hydroxyacid dehydrogenase
MTTIGFVGLGAMGSRIAGRLLEGNTLYGTNRTASRAPGATARPARSGMLTVGTAGSTL